MVCAFYVALAQTGAHSGISKKQQMVRLHSIQFLMQRTMGEKISDEAVCYEFLCENLFLLFARI
jgi:hypothetical protein